MGSQSGPEKRRGESFQVRAKEPLGTDSHQTISRNSSGCRLLIGHKKMLYTIYRAGAAVESTIASVTMSTIAANQHILCKMCSFALRVYYL